MNIDNCGFACCSHCGAEYRIFTIFNKDMQGLARAWKRRHERACIKRTPKQRLIWARPYRDKDAEGGIVVDLNHRGFTEIE